MSQNRKRKRNCVVSIIVYCSVQSGTGQLVVSDGCVWLINLTTEIRKSREIHK